MTEMLNISAPRVDRDTALELMVYHLQMAHTYYQNISKDKTVVRDEALRIFQLQYYTPMKKWEDDGGLGKAVSVKCYWEDAPEIECGMAWLQSMEEIYQKMEDEDND